MVGPRVALAGLTTLAGFGSLFAARTEGPRSMGWVGVLGIGGCLAAAFTVLPLLLPAPARPSLPSSAGKVAA